MNNLAGPEPVAIIGMAGRFPGATDIGQFWAGLRGGVQAIRFRSDDELLAARRSGPRMLADPRYVRATATAPEIDGFDAGFFGLTRSAGTDLRPAGSALPGVRACGAGRTRATTPSS